MRTMCGVQPIDRKITDDLSLLLGLNEMIDHLALASSAHWYGCVSRIKVRHALRRTLELEVEDEREAEDGVDEAGCGRSHEGWFNKARCTLPIKVD